MSEKKFALNKYIDYFGNEAVDLEQYSGNDEEIVIPDIVTEILEGVFAGNTVLKKVTISNHTNISHGAFEGCNALEEVTIIPKKKGDFNAIWIGIDAFKNCSALRRVVGSEFIRTIGSGAFWGCASLEKFRFGSVISTDKKAFYKCTALKTIEVTDIEEGSICATTFIDCPKLNELQVNGDWNAQLNSAFKPKWNPEIIHVNSINSVKAAWRLAALIGFVMDKRDYSDQEGKQYLNYAKRNREKAEALLSKYPELKMILETI